MFDVTHLFIILWQECLLGLLHLPILTMLWLLV